MTAEGGPRGADGFPGLVAAAVSGDPEALRSLLEGVWAEAYRIARSVLRDRQMAEDAVQEACAQAIVALPSLRRPEAFRAWFHRFVTRQAYRRLRQRTREAAVPVDGIEDPSAPGPASAEVLDLRRAIGALSPTYRLPVLLHYHLGLSDREAAQVLGTTAGAVRVRLAVARRRLRHALRDAPAPIVAECAPGGENASN